MEVTSQNSEQMTFLKQIYGLREVLVKTSLLQGKEAGFTVTEADCFLTSLTSSKARRKKINPNGLSSKMLKAFYLAMPDGISSNISVNWPKLGTMYSGRFLIPKITESPKTGSGCILSDILEAAVDEKYYLSDERAAVVLGKLSAVCKDIGYMTQAE